MPGLAVDRLVDPERVGCPCRDRCHCPGRRLLPWARPLKTPPHDAYRVTCGITFTHAGLRIDDNGRVHDTGRPVPRLRAIGEINKSVVLHSHPADAGLERGAVFGRIAGVGAATVVAATPARARG